MIDIKPTLTLAVIAAFISALLIITSNLVESDPSVLGKTLTEKCISIAGEGEYEIILDWQAAGYNIEKPKSVDKLIKKSDGTLIFQVIANGYEKNGINLLIAMNPDGSVKDISVAEISDMPGFGTVAKANDYINKYIGTSEAITDFDAVTNATYSSRGVVRAINTAIEVYKELGVINLNT